MSDQTRCLVCTLAEGTHFIGVAALYNSLVASGFNGAFVVGHRGEAPAWFLDQIVNVSTDVSIELRLLPKEMVGHMTNLKPHWMLNLLEENPESDAIVYFDPDVCVVAPWQHLVDWFRGGVGCAENPSPPLNPGSWRVRKWQDFYAPHGFTVRDQLSPYINAGFIGVSRDNLELLKRWRALLELVAESVGGLQVSPLPGGVADCESAGVFDAFMVHDQDALNAAVRVGPEVVRILSQDGMGFVPGVAFMTHALGYPKPWDRKFIVDAFLGRKPSYADKVFISNCQGPLRPFIDFALNWKRLSLKVACGIRGRGWS